MPLQLYQYLIVCPLVFLAGCIDAAAGCGGLISLPAYLIAGLPPHNAIASNKLSSSMGTTLAVARYARCGYIPWKFAAVCVPPALLGSNLGANLALSVSDRYFKIVMLLILPVTAVYVFRSKALIAEKEPLSPGRTALISAAISFFIGIYDGFYGPGTGTFLLLLLTALAHMKLSAANGCAKVINLATNYSALAVYLFSGEVLLPLGLTAGLFSLAGNYVGTRWFIRDGTKAVKPLMLVVLAIFFMRVLWDLFSV